MPSEAVSLVLFNKNRGRSLALQGMIITGWNSKIKVLVKVKKLFLILSLVFFVSLSSCGVLQQPKVSDLLTGVKVGMTQDEVITLFKGKPDYRRFQGSEEEWSYRRSSVLQSDYTMILIRFVDGKVTSMDSFRDPDTNNAPVNNQNSNN
jgi:hypothetical protein